MSQFETKEDIIKEYLKCGSDFNYCCEKYFKIEDKRKGKIVPFKIMKHQQKLLNAYESYDRVVCNKYRQSGISSISLAAASWRLMFIPNYHICVVANKLNLAQKGLFKIIVDFINQVPEEIRPSFTKEANSKTHKILDNGSELFISAASPEGIRGHSKLNLIILDEGSHYDTPENGFDFMTGTLSAISMGGSLWCISTPNGRGNMFYELCEEAKAGRNDFKHIELKWYEDERLIDDLEFIKGDEKVITFIPEEQEELIKQGYKPTSSWYRRECKNLLNDKQRIAQELEGIFVGSSNTVVPDEYILRQEQTNECEPIRFEEFDRNLWIWKDPEPNHKYIMGVDVSSGMGDDYSTIQVLDIDTREQVAEYQGKIFADDLASICRRVGERYNYAYIVVDITGSHGLPCILQLLTDRYPNLHYSPVKDQAAKNRLAGYQKFDGNLPGFQIGINRVEIVNDLVTAFRGDESGPHIIIHSKRLLFELKKFRDYSGRANHSRSSHDDLIFALILAIHVSQNSFSKINMGVEKTKTMISSWVVQDALTDLQNTYQPNNKWNSTNETVAPIKKKNPNDDVGGAFFVL